METEKSVDRSSGETEPERMADGAGNEHRDLPGSEARRGNMSPDSQKGGHPLETGSSKYAVKNQSSVKPEDYAHSSESGGGA